MQRQRNGRKSLSKRVHSFDRRRRCAFTVHRRAYFARFALLCACVSLPCLSNSLVSLINMRWNLLVFPCEHWCFCVCFQFSLSPFIFGRESGAASARGSNVWAMASWIAPSGKWCRIICALLCYACENEPIEAEKYTLSGRQWTTEDARFQSHADEIDGNIIQNYLQHNKATRMCGCSGPNR